MSIIKKTTTILATLSIFVACNTAKVYVSPEGNDFGSGSRSKPLATAEAALSKAAELDSENKYDNIEVIFRDGVYPVNGTVTVRGFKSKLSLVAEKGAKPIFSGEMKTGEWTAVSDSLALKMLKNPEKVLQTDLNAAGIEDLGKAIGESDRFDFYYKRKRQTLAMWPNEGFTYAGVALGETEISTYQNIHACKEPLISYIDDRISSWADEMEPCAHGYWQFDWFDLYNPIEIDVKGKKLSVNGEIGSYGFRDGCRFRGVNLLSELDMEGEYWVNRENDLLFWYAPEDAGRDGNDTAVSIFDGEHFFVFDGCSNVTLEGLEMSGTRGGGILIKDGENVVVKDCNLKRIAKDAITVSGGKNHRISGCLLTELGGAGIIMTGGDRVTLEPAGFEVSDCTVETLSLYKKTYQPCVRFGGVGLKVSHNLFRDCPSSAMRLDGNEILVEYNIFEDLVKESDDQGGIDMHNNYSFRGVVIRHNYFHNIGDPEDNIAAGVRFDDRISGMRVESNIFNHCGSSKFGAVQIHAGQDNYITGNLIYDCTFAVSQNEWTWEKWMQLSENDIKTIGLTPEMDSLTEFGKLYLSRYPEMAHMLDTSLQNKNYAYGNLIVRTPKELQLEGYIELRDNIFFPDETEHGFEYWASDDVITSYGLEAIGFSEMGPRK